MEYNLQNWNFLHFSICYYWIFSFLYLKFRSCEETRLTIVKVSRSLFQLEQVVNGSTRSPSQRSNRAKCYNYAKGLYCEMFVKFIVTKKTTVIPIRLENRIFANSKYKKNITFCKLSKLLSERVSRCRNKTKGDSSNSQIAFLHAKHFLKRTILPKKKCFKKKLNSA